MEPPLLFSNLDCSEKRSVGTAKSSAYKRYGADQPVRLGEEDHDGHGDTKFKIFG